MMYNLNKTCRRWRLNITNADKRNQRGFEINGVTYHVHELKDST